MIVPASFAEEVLALDADLAIPRAEQRPTAAFVLGERPGGELAKVQLPEGIVGPDPHRV